MINESALLIVLFVRRGSAKLENFKSVKELRWDLFQSKNLEAEKLPPTLRALKPHIQRSNLI